MKRSARRLLPALAALGLALPAQAAPAMWEVRDADSAIWLFGSISELPESLDWRTPLFDDVLTAADKVVFENDLGPAATNAIGAASLAEGIYTDGTLLTDLLDADTELTLRRAAEMAGIPTGVLISMRPWFAAGAIYVGTQVAYGLGDYSLASQLQPELPADRLIFLETLEDGMSVLAEMSEDDQLEMLTSTLGQLRTIPKRASKLTLNWVAGTPENVGDVFVMEAGAFTDGFIEQMVYARTRRWVFPVEAMLQRNEENLVIVDTANVIGDGGLLDLLGEAGYTIERVQ